MTFCALLVSDGPDLHSENSFLTQAGRRVVQLACSTEPNQKEQELNNTKVMSSVQDSPKASCFIKVTPEYEFWQSFIICSKIAFTVLGKDDIS